MKALLFSATAIAFVITTQAQASNPANTQKDSTVTAHCVAQIGVNGTVTLEESKSLTLESGKPPTLLVTHEGVSYYVNYIDGAAAAPFDALLLDRVAETRTTAMGPVMQGFGLATLVVQTAAGQRESVSCQVQR